MGVIFSGGGGQEKILPCKGGGEGRESHYMKNKNIEGMRICVFVQTFMKIFLTVLKLWSGHNFQRKNF